MIKLNFLIFLCSILLYYSCDIGPGTSGRDHCKNHEPFKLDGPSEGSKSNNASQACILPFIIVNNLGNEEFDTTILLCAIEFSELKKCDNESQLPYPIPIKY
jgi:hypothetical protein